MVEILSGVDIEIAPTPVCAIVSQIALGTSMCAYETERKLTCSHQSSKEDHNRRDATLGERDQEESNKSSADNAEADGQGTKTDSNGIIS